VTKKIRAFLQQKKFILVAVLTGVGALAAFADGSLSAIQLGVVISGVLLAVTKKAGENRQENALNEIAKKLDKGKADVGTVLDELMERLGK